MYLLDEFIEDIKDKEFYKISPFIFYKYLDEIKDEDFDLQFYKNFHQDLNNKQDIYCIFHYYNFGKYENRIPNEKFFHKIFPKFNLSDYSMIYSNKLVNQDKYQIFNHFFTNLTGVYPNLEEYKKNLKYFDINFEQDYFKYYKKVFEMDYYEMMLFFIEEKKKEKENENLESLFKIYKNDISDASKMLNISASPLDVCSKVAGVDKQYKNIIYTKKTFYKKYKNFNYIFYKKIIEEDYSEIECIYHYVYYGQYMRLPICEEESEKYIEWEKTSKKIFIILNNYYGGSFKHFYDLFENYQNLSFSFIKEIDDLDKIAKGDLLLINFPTVEFIYKIYELKERIDFKIIINIHDYFWFDNKYDVNQSGVYKNYKKSIDELNLQNKNFFNHCKYAICPSNFVKENYTDKGFNNLIKIEHSDYKKLDSQPKKIKLGKTINLGILHNYSEYKGENIYEILKLKYQDSMFKDYKIKFITLFEEIPCFHENEYFNLIEKYDIHSLLLLNEYGETWCYSLSKALKTGIPILYNDIGSFKERICNNNLCFKLFDDEETIEKFLNTKFNLDIYDKFDNFLEEIIHHHKQDIQFYKSQDIGLDMKTNLFYDSIYGNFKMSDIIDLYAIYFPQFHTIEQNNNNFYKGYTDYENLKFLKQTKSEYKIQIPQQSNYNILQKNFVENQIKLAKEYGFKGFGCYYYWFSESNHTDNMIMRKGVDKLFDVNDEEFKLFFIWANEDWDTPSHGKTNNIKNNYDTISLNKNVKNLIPYFKNTKYLLEDNKPVLFIYHPWVFPDNTLDEFKKLLNDKCLSEGFGGCKIVLNDIQKEYKNYKNFSIQPNYKKFESHIIDYNEYYEKSKFNRNSIQSFFFNFDSTPRMIKPDRTDEVRKFVNNENELNFKKYFYKTIQHYSFKNSGIDKILLINSWNEWGEQMAIEPSNEKGNYLLELIKSWYSSPLSL